MKKILILITIFLVISGCKQNQIPPMTSSQNNSTTIESTPIKSPNVNRPIQLAKLEDISLYGDKIINGNFTEIIVKSNEQSVAFPWSNVTNETYYPLLTINDINNDHKEEIIVIMTSAYGTGVAIQEVRILEKETLEEMNIENAKTFIDNNAQSSVDIVEDTVNVTLTVGDVTVQKKFDKSMATEWNEKVFFGWIIKYEVVEHRLVANLAGNVSITEFPFLVKLIYDQDLNINEVQIETE